MNHRSIKINILSAILFLLLFSFNNANAQTQTQKTNVSMTTNTGGYYEYLPQGYSSSSSTTKYPVLIFIHGMGEYGDGSSSQLWEVAKHGPNNVIKNGLMPTSFTVNGQTFKFIIISPQWKTRASVSNVNGVVDYVLSHYKADPSRIYITGLSAGAGVVEDVVSSSTVGKRFAAAVEFCGTATPSTTKAATIISNNVALWGIHNKYDDVVNSSKTVNLVNYVLSAKSTFPAKKTIPSSTSHNCWSSRYKPTFTENNLNIYQWMLLYKRGTTTTTTNQAPVANAGSDKTIALPTASVTLSGSATDADGTVASYKWTKVSGPNTPVFSSTTSRTPTVSGLIAGTYTLRLTATDDKGTTDYDDMKVVVNTSLTTTVKIEAEDFSEMRGIQAQTTTDVGGGENITGFGSTDYTTYDINTATAGTYTFTFRVATVYSGAQFAVKNTSGITLASVNVPNTGGAQTWKNVTASVKLPAGAQTLKMYATADIAWNFNYFTYVLTTATTGIQATTNAATEESGTAANSLTSTPNPFADRFVLTVNNTYTGAMKVQLVDVSGVVRKEFQVAKNAAGTVQTYLSAGTLPAGNYFVKVQMENWSQTTQIVKL